LEGHITRKFSLKNLKKINKIDISKIIQENRQKQQLLIVALLNLNGFAKRERR
jgi:hypothetical protein